MVSLLARDHGLAIHRTDDALAVMSSGLPACIFTPNDLHSDFFDLGTWLAGEVFDKYVNYRFKVAIVVPRDHDFTEWIRDCAAHRCVRYATEEATAEWLSQATGLGRG